MNSTDPSHILNHINGKNANFLYMEIQFKVKNEMAFVLFAEHAFVAQKLLYFGQFWPSDVGCCFFIVPIHKSACGRAHITAANISTIFWLNNGEDARIHAAAAAVPDLIYHREMNSKIGNNNMRAMSATNVPNLWRAADDFDVCLCGYTLVIYQIYVYIVNQRNIYGVVAVIYNKRSSICRFEFN